MVYVDNVIALANDESVLKKLVANLKEKRYDLTDDGTINKYLGVDVKHKFDGSFKLTQPYLIERILKVLGVGGDSKTNSKPTPASKPLLHKDLEGWTRKNNWNYRQAIRMLIYLQGLTHPDISMAVH